MKIFMRNIGMTLHVIHKLRADGLHNVKVNMDWQHLLMNGENLGEYAALLAARVSSGTSTRTRGGARSTTTTWSERPRSWRPSSSRSSSAVSDTGTTGSGSASTSTRTRRTRSPPCARSVLQWRFIESVAARIDGAALREAQARKDAVHAYELVYAALGA